MARSKQVPCLRTDIRGPTTKCTCMRACVRACMRACVHGRADVRACGRVRLDRCLYLDLTNLTQPTQNYTQSELPGVRPALHVRARVSAMARHQAHILKRLLSLVSVHSNCPRALALQNAVALGTFSKVRSIVTFHSKHIRALTTQNAMARHQARDTARSRAPA